MFFLTCKVVRKASPNHQTASRNSPLAKRGECSTTGVPTGAFDRFRSLTRRCWKHGWAAGVGQKGDIFQGKIILNGVGREIIESYNIEVFLEGLLKSTQLCDS